MTSRSVDRALDVLRLVAKSTGPVRPTEIASVTAIPKGTLHAILASLEAAMFLARRPDGYVIGIGAFEVGTALPEAATLRDAVANLLDELAAATGEACNLGELNGGDVVYLDRRDTGHALRFAVRVGQRLPAYGTALGKAMLALQPDSEIKRLYPARLARLTTKTPSTRVSLLGELGEVRDRGFAIESEESTPSVRCVGVAAHSGDRIIGLSVSAPVQRATLEELIAHVPLLRRTVSSVADSLAAHRWLSGEQAG